MTQVRQLMADTGVQDGDLLSENPAVRQRAKDLVTTTTAFTARSIVNAYRRWLPELPDEIVIHFRWASVGGVDADLCHPFPVTRKAETDLFGTAEAVLFHNGTWGAYDEALRRLYRRAAVLIHPQIEDFGIAAVEAQACGLPVVAFRAGGALETVVENKSGIFFDEPSVASLVDAISQAPKSGQGLAKAGLDCRRSAERFTAERFDAAMEAVMLNALSERPNS